VSPGSRRRGGFGGLRARLAGPRPWLFVATLALGAAGWGFAGLIYPTGDPEARALRLAGGLAAATVAAPAWYLLVTRPGRHTLPRGAVAGLLAGVASYPLFFTYALPLTEVAKGRPAGAAIGLGIGFAFGVTVGLFGLLFAPFSGAVGLVTGVGVTLLARPFTGTGGAGEDGDPGPGGAGDSAFTDPADPSARETGESEDGVTRDPP